MVEKGPMEVPPWSKKERGNARKVIIEAPIGIRIGVKGYIACKRFEFVPRFRSGRAEDLAVTTTNY